MAKIIQYAKKQELMRKNWNELTRICKKYQLDTPIKKNVQLIQIMLSKVNTTSITKMQHKDKQQLHHYKKRNIQLLNMFGIR